MTPSQRITPLWLGGFLAALLAFAVLLSWSEATLKLDRLLHDAFVRAGQRPPPADIVIAAIDEPSLAELGRWPWSRDLQALVYGELAALGARAVISDVIYAEPSARPGDDARLAEAMSQLQTVVLPVLIDNNGGSGSRGRVPERLPLPVLVPAVDALGHVVLPTDSDGIVRRVHLKSGFRRAHWSTLSLAALEVIDPESVAAWSSPEPSASGTGTLESGNGWTVDREVLVPFYGPSGSFERVPAADLVLGRVAPEAIRGRTVLLGLTTTGLGDIVPTPVSALDRPLPGVEVHANVLAALREQALVTSASRWLGPGIAIVALPLLLLAYSRGPPQWTLAMAVGGACLPIVASFVLYRWHDLWYPPVSASLPILASYLFWSRHRLAFINRFLEAEHDKLAAHLPRRDSRANPRLADFFRHAMRHLPIEGWAFTAHGERFSGGTVLPEGALQRVGSTWRVLTGPGAASASDPALPPDGAPGTVHVRRFPTSGRLTVAVRIKDDDKAGAVLDYIDSLARIRSRKPSSVLSGSLERLQGNASRLSDELSWLRSVKIFSETVLAGSPVGFAVWNPAGELVRDNALVQSLVPGLSRRHPLADFLLALGCDPDEPLWRERLDALLLHAEPWQITATMHERELVVSLSAIGSHLHERLICASVLDVSDIRTAERARSELVDYLSHDLRSPLISALYGVENAAADTVESARARRDISGHIRKSLAMMDDLLHIARADALDADRFGDVLLDDVLDNALDQLAPQARARRIELAFAAAAPECWLLGDAGSLERAFANIIGNAIKYSRDGGRVALAVRIDDVTADVHEAVIGITDHGVGIDPAIIDGLFVRFRRDPRSARSHAGIGLGLAFVSRVVAQHGGTVTASSSPAGTTIEVRLPLRESRSVPSSAPEGLSGRSFDDGQASSVSERPSG